MLSKKEQNRLKQEIKGRLMIRCNTCCQSKLKKEFSYIDTYMGNICMDCQEEDNY